MVFEDISDETVKGQVLKPFEKDVIPRERNDPLPGRIKYRAPDYSEVEVSFGEKDQKGDFTLRLDILLGLIVILTRIINSVNNAKNLIKMRQIMKS